ncbi:uncharacterized protein HKW66_Vig0128060 [Vigna angularis]|uniref:Uncharacterized protein n=1 Tax=Phaseolus angularis TaxID=3914 RepID=A0A8T0K5X0_PHAAN|nr:uncharacterized protein HKW66_Vig0128060 [Vigna angularis]
MSCHIFLDLTTWVSPQVIMYISLSSSFEESKGRGGRRYVDGVSSSSELSIGCQQGVDEGGEERVDSALVGRTRRVLGLGATAEDEGVDDGGRGGCKNGEDEEEKETMHGWVWHGACVEAKRGVVFWGECCYCYGEGCFRENLRKEVTKLMQEEAIYGCGKKSNFASMEDDFANSAAHGSMKKTNLVRKDDGPGTLRDGDKDCRTDDEALDLDDSCGGLRKSCDGGGAEVIWVAQRSEESFVRLGGDRDFDGGGHGGCA